MTPLTPSPQRLLPGLQAPPKSRDGTPLTLPMREVSAGDTMEAPP